MKKQFQILSIAITILLFSCGRHNAEIRGPITKKVKELSTNSSSANNEFDLWLIDAEGRIRLNADLKARAKELQDKPSDERRTSHTIDRNRRIETTINLN